MSHPCYGPATVPQASAGGEWTLRHGSGPPSVVAGPQPRLTLGTVGGDGAPTARRPRPHLGRAPLGQLDQLVHAVHRAAQRGFQQRDGHRLGLGPRRVQVVRRQHAGRHPEAQRLEQRVEAKVLAVAGDRHARLEVDDHLVGAARIELAERQVHLAAEHDRAPDQLHVRTALGDRPPAGLERREALLELRDEVGGLAAQLRPVGLGQPGEERPGPGVAVGDAGDGVVDQVGRHRLAAPVDGQLDGLVSHLAPDVGDAPRERGLVGDVVGLATVDARERVLADPEPLTPQRGFEASGQRGQRLLQLGLEAGGEVVRERDARLGVAAAEQLDHPLLSGVVGDHADQRTQGASQSSGPWRARDVRRVERVETPSHPLA